MNHNHLRTVVAPIHYFTWNPESRVLSSEISDLIAAGFFPGELMRPLFKDACDVGFSIIGKNQTVRFYLEEIVRNDEEGEIESWNFRNERSHNPNVAMADLRVVIFND